MSKRNARTLSRVRYTVLLLDPIEPEQQEALLRLRQLGFDAMSASSFEQAALLLRTESAIHVVLTEWEMPARAGEGGGSIRGAALFAEILKIRYEVNIILFTAEKDAKSVTTGGMVNGYFYKGDHDWDEIGRKIRNEIKNSKDRAPFFERLVEYSRQSKDSWHTPGHASGYSVKGSPWVKDFHDFFGQNSFSADISVSVPALDSLLQPRGVIQEAQELAARAFSARYTFFSTNGTSTANKVVLQALLRPGDAVLLDRNCHKSVHYAVVLSGAEPVYLLPSVNNRFGIFGPVPKKRILGTLDRALAAGKKVRVLVLTNCTYDGLIYDVADIVGACHARGVLVLVDEAWFGYARFHPEFYPCAMEAGADYATQSTHKTMSAFSQGSMIHVRDPGFEEIQEHFRECYNMHTSTSPQYPMIASLDVARKQMVMEGHALLSRALELSDSLREAINSLQKFRVLTLSDMIADELSADNVRLDRTKLTIDVSRSGFSSKQVEHFLLTKHNIQIEKTTFNTLSVLITIGATRSKLNRLFLALENIERMGGTGDPAQAVSSHVELSLSPMRFMPREAFYCQGEPVLLREAVHRVSTSMVVPYPPGIPLLVPGQLVNEKIVRALFSYRDLDVEIHGLTDGTLRVMTREEERRFAGTGAELLAPAETRA